MVLAEKPGVIGLAENVVSLDSEANEDLFVPYIQLVSDVTETDLRESASRTGGTISEAYSGRYIVENGVCVPARDYVTINYPHTKNAIQLTIGNPDPNHWRPGDVYAPQCNIGITTLSLRHAAVVHREHVFEAVIPVQDDKDSNIISVRFSRKNVIFEKGPSKAFDIFTRIAAARATWAYSHRTIQ